MTYVAFRTFELELYAKIIEIAFVCGCTRVLSGIKTDFVLSLVTFWRERKVKGRQTTILSNFYKYVLYNFFFIRQGRY